MRIKVADLYNNAGLLIIHDAEDLIKAQLPAHLPPQSDLKTP